MLSDSSLYDGLSDLPSSIYGYHLHVKCVKAYLDGFPVSEIASFCGSHPCEKTIVRWVDDFFRLGCIPVSTGRKGLQQKGRNFEQLEIVMLRDIVKHNEALTLRGIAVELEKVFGAIDKSFSEVTSRNWSMGGSLNRTRLLHGHRSSEAKCRSYKLLRLLKVAVERKGNIFIRELVHRGLIVFIRAVKHLDGLDSCLSWHRRAWASVNSPLPFIPHPSSAISTTNVKWRIFTECEAHPSSSTSPSFPKSHSLSGKASHCSRPSPPSIC